MIFFSAFFLLHIIKKFEGVRLSSLRLNSLFVHGELLKSGSTLTLNFACTQYKFFTTMRDQSMSNHLCWRTYGSGYAKPHVVPLCIIALAYMQIPHVPNFNVKLSVNKCTNYCRGIQAIRHVPNCNVKLSLNSCTNYLAYGRLQRPQAYLSCSWDFTRWSSTVSFCLKGKHWIDSVSRDVHK